MTITMTIKIDLTEEELKTVEKIQQQHGFTSAQEAAQSVIKHKLERVRQQLTGDIGQPTWVAK